MTAAHYGFPDACETTAIYSRVCSEVLLDFQFRDKLILPELRNEIEKTEIINPLV